jgi:flagellar motor switch protein FliM
MTATTYQRTRRIRSYDFRRPDKLSREYARVMQIVGETYARQLGTQISSRLRAATQVTFDNVAQSSYDEWVTETPSPSFLALFKFDTDRTFAPLPGTFALAMPIDVAFAFYELLLGGTVSAQSPQRSMTEVEQVVLAQFVADLAGELSYAFEQAPYRVKALPVTIEYNPQFAQIASPADTVIPVTFNMRVDTIESKLTLCFPYTMLSPMFEMTSSRSNIDDVNERAAATVKLAAQLDDTAVVVDMRIPPRTMTAEQVSNLEIGDVIALAHPTSSPLLLCAGGAQVGTVLSRESGRRAAAQIHTIEHT